jgi:4-amino-4-deoxy-L-arabinose transferase-like glycosyltransferase
MQKNILHKYNWLIIPVIFLIYSAPGALDYVFYYPDEKYYTDAVLQMMDKNECFTPYKADGSPRFKKPILTYWVLMGSYKILGISKFSSRLLFWLAGAMLTVIVFFMARSLTGNNKTAFLSAFITASNPLALMSASRSIPDILLVLFLAISAWGFLEILISENIRTRYYWMAYMGAALAFETKGIPAAAFSGISILYILFNPWKRKNIRQLIHTPAILTSLAVALSWFVIMYVEHGTTYLSSFFADQVGDRVAFRISQIFINAFIGIVTLLAFSLPWIVIVLSRPEKIKSFISILDNKSKSVFGFTAGWLVMLIIMSGAVFKFYDRYILPVVPLTSLFFAWIISRSEIRWGKPVFNFFLAMVMITLSVNILYAVFILPEKILVAGIIFALILVSSYFAGLLKKVSTEILLANGVMLLYFNIFVLLHPLIMPGPGEQLVNALKEKGITEKEKVYVYGNIRTASNIRIHSHGNFEVVSMDTVYNVPEGQDHFLVFREKDQKYLNLEGYGICKGSEEYSRVPAGKFPGILREPIAELKKNGQHYLIAEPK